MKKIVFVLLAVVSLLLVINASAEIEIRYDKFKDMTIVMTKPGSVSTAPTSPGITWMGWYKGTVISIPKEVILKFVSSSRSWQYLRCHEVGCLVDGKIVRLPESKHHGSTNRGGVLEQISVVIPFETAKQIAFAEKVEFKICNAEFAMGKYDHDDAQTFIKKFEN